MCQGASLSPAEHFANALGELFISSAHAAGCEAIALNVLVGALIISGVMATKTPEERQKMAHDLGVIINAAGDIIDNAGQKIGNIIKDAPSGSTASAGGAAPDPDDDPNWDKDNLEKHYDKHSNEWGDITQEQYASKANDLLNSQVDNKNILSYTRASGDTLKYNVKTNEFISINPEGQIRTFFRPSNGMDYWLKQVK